MMQQSNALSLIVSKVRELGPRIRAYELRNAAGDELPLVTAGSHLDIKVQLADGKTGIRQYAICNNPAQRELYEIVVLLEDQRCSAAQFIFTHFHVGTLVECPLPNNNFQLHADSSPAILIAGGIGIAPIKAIAHTLALRGRRFTLHYAGASKTDMAFADELAIYFSHNLVMHVEDENHHLDIMNLLAGMPANAYIYACGPQSMLEDIETSARLLAIPKDQIQVEYFYSSADQKDKDVLLELAYSDKLITVDANQSLLNAVRDAGINTSFDCCVGDCGSCAVKVLAGDVEHRDHVLSDTQKAQGFMCLCVSRARSEKLVIAL
jgi:ferredoxin-NADP reductase